VKGVRRGGEEVTTTTRDPLGQRHYADVNYIDKVSIGRGEVGQLQVSRRGKVRRGLSGVRSIVTLTVPLVRSSTQLNRICRPEKFDLNQTIRLNRRESRVNEFEFLSRLFWSGPTRRLSSAGETSPPKTLEVRGLVPRRGRVKRAHDGENLKIIIFSR